LRNKENDTLDNTVPFVNWIFTLFHSCIH